MARTNGELDFLPPGGGEPHCYDEFIATVDALVMARLDTAIRQRSRPERVCSCRLTFIQAEAASWLGLIPTGVSSVSSNEPQLGGLPLPWVWSEAVDKMFAGQ